MAQIKHNGGIVEAVSELGFDQVKYFEGTIGNTATGFVIDPPARRIVLNNKSTTEDVYLRINGSPAVASAGFAPGDDIKICPGGTFSMDFDAIQEISMISPATADVEGVLGFKGTVCW
jgi:hypothetical protein